MRRLEHAHARRAHALSPHAAYTERRAPAQAALARLDRVSARFANARALVFLAAAVCAGLVLLERLPKRGWWAALALLGLYMLLAALHHQRLPARGAGAAATCALNERGLARLGRGWHDFPERGERFLDAGHLYAPDLDVFGQGSLFQLLERDGHARGRGAARGAGSPRRRRRRRSRARQGAVRELAPLRRLPPGAVRGGARWSARDKADPRRFIPWAEGGPSLRAIRWARPLALVLPLVTLTLYRARPAARWCRARCGGLGLLAQLGVVLATAQALGECDERMSAGERGFVRYAAALRARGGGSPSRTRACSGSSRACSARGRAGVRPAARFSRLYSLRRARAAPVPPGGHLFTLWDIHALFALEGWRTQHGAAGARLVRGARGAGGALRAWRGSRTTGRTSPSRCWRTRAARGGEGLGHPLLDAPVLNDVTLPGAAARAADHRLQHVREDDAACARWGPTRCSRSRARRCARRRCALHALQVLTSMRVKDSLERGVSYFYAEVQRHQGGAGRGAGGQRAGALPAGRDPARHQHPRAADRLARGAAAAARHRRLRRR